MTQTLMTVYPRKQEYNEITNNQQLQFFMTNQYGVCEIFGKWLKHDFVKNNIIYFKILVDDRS